MTSATSPIYTQLTTALADRYRIERELGAGGMATVYLAHDLKHDRKVAIKVLKPELAAVLGAERFVVEIKTTAALQHPHILPLFDSGTADGLLYYVMPYVEGETIREKLDRETQFGVDDAVRIACEVADALDYAHRHAVIHRDIKPENILLHDGRAMVMDFGIALAVSAAAGGRMTETGLSLGTPHYMSPEQATAEKDITPRSDVYSLASVLYEMLTGTPPHTGASAQQVIMRIIAEPAEAVTKYRKSVPPNVAAAIAKALEKLPADRWESARAFSDALTGARPVPTMSAAAGVVRGRERAERRLRATAIAGWTAAAAVGAAFVVNRPTIAADPVVARFALSLPDSVGIANVPAGGRIAIAPDGSAIAVVGGPRSQSKLYVRAMDGAAFLPIAGTDSALNPSFSLDGRWLLYSNGRRLFKVPVGGGTPQVVADSAPTAFSSWGPGPEGELILFARSGGIYGVSPNGGGARRIVGSDSSKYRFIRPVALPGGKVLLASRSTSRTSTVDSARLVAVTIDRGEVKDLGLMGYAARYASRRIVFAQQGLLLSAPFSLSKLAVTGPAERVADNVAQRAGGATDFAVADNGTLVTIGASDAGTRDLLVISRTGQRRPPAFPREPYFDARVSPDGRRAVVQIMPPGLGGGATRGDLWVYDLADGTRSRLTRDTSGIRGEWTRGSDTVVYIGHRGDSPDSANLILSIALTAGATPIVLGGGRGYAEVSPSVAGGYWAVRRGGLGRGGAIHIARADSLKNFRPFIATPAGDPRVSPNGRLLAFSSSETGAVEVYVQPIPGPGQRVTVSVNGGRKPRWSRDGRTLYFQSGPDPLGGQLTAATIVESPALAVTRREDLFPWSFTNIDPFPSDREFLVVDAAPIVRQEVSVVLNWPQLLKPRTALK